jgi:type II secretory pathway pseudopilin PulG
MHFTASSWKRNHGYTLLEIIVVVGIVIVGSAVAMPVTMQMVQNAKGDSAMTMTASFLQTARNRAVAERRNILISWVSSTEMKAERVEVPGGQLTLVDALVLEGEEQFIKLDEIDQDTPAGFGFDDNINFTGPTPVMFTSDGSLIDAAGDVTNGTIFVARPDTPETARAVTIMGVTGLIRSFKWRGTTWQE